jgi:hypothetical protein
MAGRACDRRVARAARTCDWSTPSPLEGSRRSRRTRPSIQATRRSSTATRAQRSTWPPARRVEAQRNAPRRPPRALSAALNMSGRYQLRSTGNAAKLAQADPSARRGCASPPRSAPRPHLRLAPGRPPHFRDPPAARTIALTDGARLSSLLDESCTATTTTGTRRRLPSARSRLRRIDSSTRTTCVAETPIRAPRTCTSTRSSTAPCTPTRMRPAWARSNAQQDALGGLGGHRATCHARSAATWGLNRGRVRRVVSASLRRAFQRLALACAALCALCESGADPDRCRASTLRFSSDELPGFLLSDGPRRHYRLSRSVAPRSAAPTRRVGGPQGRRALSPAHAGWPLPVRALPGLLVVLALGG